VEVAVDGRVGFGCAFQIPHGPIEIFNDHLNLPDVED
jgi:hypothetical protein